MIIRIKYTNENELFVGKALKFHEITKTANEIFEKHDKESFVAEFCARLGYKELPYSEGYADFIINLEERIVYVTPHTFPKELDGAKVLYFTEKGVFDPVYYAGGGTANKVCYLAICTYGKDNDFYIFDINENLEVVADGCFDSLEACRKFMGEYEITWHQHKELL